MTREENELFESYVYWPKEWLDDIVSYCRENKITPPELLQKLQQPSIGFSLDDMTELKFELEAAIKFKKDAADKAQSRGNHGAEKMWLHKASGLEEARHKLRHLIERKQFDLSNHSRENEASI